MMNNKIVAGFEMMLMIGMLFAFCYFVSFDFKMVSAEEIGCCSLMESGEKCGTTTSGTCVGDFAEGELCSKTSFCEKGCCFDDLTGTYDKNVLNGDCGVSWVRDPNCNMPAADLGCCILSTSSNYETEGQCKIDTLALALGDGVIDWRGDVGEDECLVLGATQEMGACVLGGGNCKFVTGVECVGYSGDFYEGTLCSSSSIDSDCNMTKQTKCVDGKDEVYFVDSCGNIANIYDSERVDDVSYWDTVVSGENVCGSENAEGNANSKDCGNCNRFTGGSCSSAVEDGFDVDVGSFYCKDTSCMFGGERYENGESWCVYDGAIGNGDDVVGSRHWKYVCSQGVTQVEPCADYRNQICIQSNIGNSNGGEFSNAACVANNWRECINLNNEEDGLESCSETLNCRIDTVNIADQFKFDVCLPKYPSGFSLSDSRYQSTAKSICGMANQKCTIVRQAKKWGGCKIVANEGCGTAAFAQEMNDFCTGLGDCGGSVNILGDYSENYVVRRNGAKDVAMYLSEDWKNALKNLAIPVHGQFAEVENYSEYLGAAGVLGAPVSPEEEGLDWNIIGSGFAGIGMAMRYASPYIMPGFGGELGINAFGGTASVSALSGVAIGAGVGMVVGSMLASYLGLSSGGSMLMATGGAMIGAYVMITQGWMGAGALQGMIFVGPLLWLGIAFIFISLFFGGKNCSSIEIEFECKPWKPLAGGDSCQECNNDPLKPCSEYRCKSLGATCGLVDVGSDKEVCWSSTSSEVPFAISPIVDVDGDGISDDVDDDINIDGDGLNPNDINDNGFSLSGIDGGCFDAYNSVVFGVTTSELAYCRLDIEDKSFDDMSYDLGGNSYLYNHMARFDLPDPSHMESQGINWTGDLNLFVKCEDAYGNVNDGTYKIGMCVVDNDEPDKNAPKITLVSPLNNKLIGFDVAEVEVEVVTNELASCRWSLSNIDYSAMENDLNCGDSFGVPSNTLGYVCNGTLPINNSNPVYYIRCGDQPWLNDINDRNFNLNSFVYSLKKPESKIAIDWLAPSQNIVVNTDSTTIELRVSTSGGGDSHFCSYSFSGYDKMIDIIETGNSLHSQILNRPAGENKIFVECHDETGDFDQDLTEFEIIKDISVPQVARVWQNNGKLYVVTNGNADCRISNDGCGFAWMDGEDMGSGKNHVIDVINGKDYYIRCGDELGNAPIGCSLQVRAL
ncbi:MAG: hypothetical protein V1888_02690 [archaeon]